MKYKRIAALGFLAPIIWVLPNMATAATISVNCGAGQKIRGAVNSAAPGDVIKVRGTCNENVVIHEGKRSITLDGLTAAGNATINGVDATSSTVQVTGREITIKNLIITGGQNGIIVTRGGSAVIDNNTIQEVGANGIQVNQDSSARIINNEIQNNTSGCGIFVNENASARIGFVMGDDTVASPNTITGNADGICVRRSSSARIVGNVISSNVGDGVSVTRVSHADISSNTIDSNGGDGIRFGENSGVNLGADSGTDIFDSPNSTTANNTGFGISCFINSYAQGRQDTLNGNAGATDFPAGCISSLSP